MWVGVGCVVTVMKVVPRPHGLEDVIGKSGSVRSPGLHVSTIYGSLYSELEPNRYKAGSLPNPLLLEAGLAFENFFEDELKKRWGPLLGERPEEQMTEEGIAFSPDLFIYDDVKGLILGEIKCTWMSGRELPREPANGFPPKFDRYTTQMQAYCFNLGTPHARLFIFCVNGDYDRAKGVAPELHCFDITYTQRELRENWELLMNHARLKGLL